MIPEVAQGDPLLASQMNSVIQAVNGLEQPLGYQSEEPWYESFDAEAMPWHVDENSLSVYRPIVYVGDVEYTAEQYDDLQTEGGTLQKRDHGSFYVGYNDASTHVQIYDYWQMQELKSQEISSPQKHWSFQHVYDVNSLSVIDQLSSVGPWRTAYFNIRPTFGAGDGSIDLDLSSLNWVKISSMVSAEGEEPHVEWNDSTSAQIWDYARLENGDIADAAELTSNPGYKFLVRPPDGTPHLKYADLSTLSNVISGSGHGCSCQMSAVMGAETYQDLAYRTNTQIAQFKDCHGNTTNVYAPDSVRFQGNVGARTKTGWNQIFGFETMTSSNVQVICQGSTIQIGCFYV